jgi:hypothetical protein
MGTEITTVKSEERIIQLSHRQEKKGRQLSAAVCSLDLLANTKNYEMHYHETDDEWCISLQVRVLEVTGSIQLLRSAITGFLTSLSCLSRKLLQHHI